MSSLIAWPLERNTVRRESRNNAFGMVDDSATEHRGWDLAAPPLTPCYAIADGVIARSRLSRSCGNWIALRFQHASLGTLYAVYCHLSSSYMFESDLVKRGDVIGLTGNTGDAASTHGEDQYLHFEIRTVLEPRKGPGGRIDPSRLYGGLAPIGRTFFGGHGGKVSN